ncbi:MAG TPA: TROVE domain-containing protein [Polyangiaceae bacterium]|nr:TROVE domain-containing protein [Polyangiaceae bacterium]
MARYAQHVSPAPQHAKAREGQVMNHAGGYVFAVDKWTQLDRFLILGCEGNTYYATERAMTVDNAKCVRACLDEDGPRAVARIAEVSDAGRAPKNDPAVFALAMAAGHPDPATRKAALSALPRVCRIGTHLFHFARDVGTFRRWGRGLRSAVAAWYNDMTAERLALQVAKYRQRDGFSHRDLLRLAHPVGKTPAHNAVFRWVAGEGSAALDHETRRGQAPSRADLPELLLAFESLQAASSTKDVVALIRKHRLTHEMLPTEWKTKLEVWDALLDEMPLTALVRNLGKMTEVGLLASLSEPARRACQQLTDPAKLHRARVHPLSLLAALKVYEQGHGEKGKLTWKPVRSIVDALNEAFYLSFKSLEPTGKNHLLALDVSGSMTWGNLAGMPGVNPRVGSAAMAMATARVEQSWHVMGFSNTLVNIDISPKMSLDDTIKKIERVPMGGTDCALPMIYAKQNKLAVDTFVVYTDNETWAGKVHPFQALRDYRQASGRPAKLVVVGMTATRFTIADPSDAGMLDVVGFDSAAPAILADFARA